MPGFLYGEDLSPNTIERARRATGEYIDLTSSNPTHQGLLFPADVLRAASDAYWSNRRYDPEPRGLRSARLAIARYYAERTPALALDADQIVVTASTSEAYSLLFALLTDPGDNVLAPAITYPLFEYLAMAHHIELRPYALDERRGWRIDPTSLRLQADERTRAVLVVSPHNPTGAVLASRLPALRALNLPIICDEVFAAFPYRVATVPPLGALYPDLPVFHLNGISKMFALPDLKLGWIALNDAAHNQFGERLEVLNDTFLSANTLTQTMLPLIFERGRSFTAAMHERIRQSLDMAITLLSGCDVVRVRPPDGGYYLFPEILGCNDEEALILHLLKHGVLVHPGYFYGYEQGAHIVISCLVEPAQLRAGIERLIGALSAWVSTRDSSS
ncbi:MAG: pyridoxal phosphate-dependent aminotransferase [Roseiflexus sp.]|nr:pyridoxal phosphate-dependent aminotransferase [Roseiflexus sp.]MCS7290978.1 pyridoxal phosphate-dependent aminotransferase [Roseiflexus sp.]MDW8147753.1 pyridoxal phosphate-dependent aminotransferase [Roseiflexaceae bacterium]MDW8232812.1 pyridoxal phosphate-dependent aminotransferase [Roseiflexaceae bacterium]